MELVSSLQAPTATATPAAAAAAAAPAALHGAITIDQVGMQTVIALAEDGSSWMVAYSHYDDAMSSGLVRTKLSETVIVRL